MVGIIEVNVPRGVDVVAAKRVLERLMEDRGRFVRVSEALAREAAPMGPGALAQAGRIDRAWRDVERTYGLYTAEQAARLTGSHAAKVSSHVHNLRRRKGLLAVRRGGVQAFPGFQFTGAKVRPEWSSLTAHLLAAGWAEDEILLWFASPTGLLSGSRPADLLDTDPHRVRAAVSEAASGTSA